MWIKVYCSEDIVKGDVLSFNEASQLWEKTSTMASPIGVAKEDATSREDLNNNQRWACKMSSSGDCYAKASRDIPNQGGELKIENGKVYVDNSADACGIIYPNFIDKPQRVADELVMIFIR